METHKINRNNTRLTCSILTEHKNYPLIRIRIQHNCHKNYHISYHMVSLWLGSLFQSAGPVIFVVKLLLFTMNNIIFENIFQNSGRKIEIICAISQ